jgi:indoleamine 2,3-dioxygenase
MSINDCWDVTRGRGFLMSPDPLPYLTAVESPLADAIPRHLETLMQAFHRNLDLSIALAAVLPIYDMSMLATADSRLIERAFQIYSFLASAYIYKLNTIGQQTKILPRGIAVPLVQLADMLHRPPILAYAAYTLANWQRIVPEKPIEVENLRLIQQFIPKRDAEWFTIIHVDMEAKAGAAIDEIPLMMRAAEAENEDTASLISGLQTVSNTLHAMMATFNRMPEHCHPQVYYHEVRPYIFGFDDVIYEDVEKFGGKPQSFRGETGAQSSVIPALIRVLGLSHENTELTQHLQVMLDYMPVPHREFLAEIQPIRPLVERTASAPLREVYNHTLEQLLAFRQMHLRFAASYIANQSAHSQGTGGTEFMVWLQQLIRETEAQML